MVRGPHAFGICVNYFFRRLYRRKSLEQEEPSFMQIPLHHSLISRVSLMNPSLSRDGKNGRPCKLNGVQKPRSYTLFSSSRYFHSTHSKKAFVATHSITKLFLDCFFYKEPLACTSGLLGGLRASRELTRGIL
jgi:hypothetical protein